MKKEVSQFIRSKGFIPAYLGNKKTMFIKGFILEEYDIEEQILDKFGFGLPFKIAQSSYYPMLKKPSSNGWS